MGYDELQHRAAQLLNVQGSRRDGTGIPATMIQRWSSAWTAPGGLPNTGNYTWAVPPTLGSCFMMRVVVTDKAEQTRLGLEWAWVTRQHRSGPVDGPLPDLGLRPDEPNVTWQAPAAKACIGARDRQEETGNLGPFTVKANDPESGIDWVFFQAKWPSGTSTIRISGFPGSDEPVVQPALLPVYAARTTGNVCLIVPPPDMNWLARRHPLRCLGDGPEHGRQYQDREGHGPGVGGSRMLWEPSSFIPLPMARASMRCYHAGHLQEPGRA